MPTRARQHGAKSRYTDRVALNELFGGGHDAEDSSTLASADGDACWTSNDNENPKFHRAPIRLVRASYLIQLHQGQKVISRRQDLPNCAFFDRTITKETEIVVLSCPWLSPSHPDPVGYHLSVLSPILTAYMAYKKTEGLLKEGEAAVFWDYPCLFQGSDRSSAERCCFDKSLQVMDRLYAHARTNVWCLSRLPVGTPRSYHSRGWCRFEYTVSAIIKTSRRFLDLGLLSIDAAQVMDFREQVECLKGIRRPPIPPSEFRTLFFETDNTGDFLLSFFAEVDRENVVALYERQFGQLLGDTDRLELKRLQWTDADIAKFVQILPYCSKLETLYLDFNNLSDTGARRVAQALPPTIKAVDFRHNPQMSFSFVEAEPNESVWWKHLDEEGRRARADWRQRYLAAFLEYYRDEDSHRHDEDPS